MNTNGLKKLIIIRVKYYALSHPFTQQTESRLPFELAKSRKLPHKTDGYKYIILHTMGIF